MGNYGAAIEDFNDVIRLDPEDTYAYANKGLAQSYMGALEDAIADFDAAIRLDAIIPDFY